MGNNIKLKKSEFISLIKEETSLGSVLGSPQDPNGGYFLGPLGGVGTAIIKRRILYPIHGVKNSSGEVGRLVEPPQGRVTESVDMMSNEYIYSTDGKKVTTKNIQEWFGGHLGKKPSYNGGKFVDIEPKCLTFPYCSQGAIDHPIKLIGEGCICEDCKEFCTEIAKISGKTPEYIVEVIRNKYLSY